MATDRRLIYLRKWWERALKEEDPFDRFIYLWLALIVAAQRLRTDRGARAVDASDRDKVREYFDWKRDQVLASFSENEERLRALATRRGTTYRDPIIDTGSQELRHRFKRLADHYSGGSRISDELRVEAVAELLNKVRNNLFHGDKVYDDHEDIDLLRLVNPIIESVLARCEASHLTAA